jgi:hypothetical protein
VSDDEKDADGDRDQHQHHDDTLEGEPEYVVEILFHVGRS